MEESSVPGGSHYGKILNKFVINVINNELKLKFENGQMKYNTQFVRTCSYKDKVIATIYFTAIYNIHTKVIYLII